MDSPISPSATSGPSIDMILDDDLLLTDDLDFLSDIVMNDQSHFLNQQQLSSDPPSNPIYDSSNITMVPQHCNDHGQYYEQHPPPSSSPPPPLHPKSKSHPKIKTDRSQTTATTTASTSSSSSSIIPRKQPQPQPQQDTSSSSSRHSYEFFPFDPLPPTLVPKSKTLATLFPSLTRLQKTGKQSSQTSWKRLNKSKLFDELLLANSLVTKQLDFLRKTLHSLNHPSKLLKVTVKIPSIPDFTPLEMVAVEVNKSSISKRNKDKSRKWAKSIVEAGKKINKFGNKKFGGGGETSTNPKNLHTTTNPNHQSSPPPPSPPPLNPRSTIWTLTSLYFNPPTLHDYQTIFSSHPSEAVFNTKGVGELEGKRKRLVEEERKVRRKLESVEMKFDQL
ncbi:hypothetical protein TrLO_g5988 [Triparma laevis f. longispina]|uniref:Uncharacterized protein n=1 Tax=Triparma laevis f. longispina TaxID=1714387 RepID=A0A9W7C7A3_9STRA|nr:hypothetical protein TrLO_g5988 [Triparma laevis f. longispina]